MSYYILDDRLYFPPLEEADENGLLAIGGDLSPERLKLAYQSGIFPWYNEDEPILWWSPDPRFILFPENLKVSKSTRAKIRKMNYRLEVNTHFEEVMKNCQTAYRPDQGGTWINNEMIESYQLLHKQGWASSASLWDGEEMIGGLYGIQVGTVFCGESMFHKVSDASKICFTLFVQDLIEKGIKIIDCQVYTEHLSSLGAEYISRDTFIPYLSPPIS